MLLTQKQKIFQQTKSYKLQIITITFFYSFWNSFWYVSFIFSVLFLINIQMCSLYQSYYWMPDFSLSFLLSGLIEFSVPLPSDHPIYLLLFRWYCHYNKFIFHNTHALIITSIIFKCLIRIWSRLHSQIPIESVTPVLDIKIPHRRYPL